MSSPNSISGAYLEAEIGGVEVNGLHAWEADDAGGDVLEATTSKGLGATNTDTGCIDLKVTLRLYFNIADGIQVDLRFGTILLNVWLFRNRGDSLPAFQMPVAVVIGSPQTVEVRGRCEMTVTIKNKGQWVDNRY